MHVYILTGTKALRMKMIFHIQDYPDFGFLTCRLKVGGKTGSWALSGHRKFDELTLQLDNLSGWRDVILQVKNFPSSRGVPVIEHLTIYTKNE